MASIELIKSSDGTGNAAVATVQTTRSPGASTIIVDTVQGINPAGFMASMGTPHTFVDPVTAETITVISEATCVDFAGHVDGSNLEIDTIAPGQSDLGSSAEDIIIIRPTTQWGDNLADVLDVAHDDDGKIKVGAANRSVQLSQGQLLNGKIARTVSSNNITVAIKTLNDADPSASDPVYVRIGNTIRAITAALSVTKNAGTNWFGSGGTMFATYEIDYFVYLGYNATDGVTIGFARIPWALTYGDFSTTTTDEKYCAISTITTAASTDEYENVGRFNATLSATASFNWSVPATSIIINRPIFVTRKLSYLPTFTGTLGTGGTLNGRYVIDNRSMDVNLHLILGTGGLHGSGATYSLPLNCDTDEHNSSPESAGIIVGQFYDNSAAKGYMFFTRINSATTVRPIYLAAITGDTTGTPPATPAISDRFTQRLRLNIA